MNRLAIAACVTAAMFCSLQLACPASASEPAPDQPKFVQVDDLTELKKIIVDESDLKDPFSVEFRRVQLGETPVGGTLWCGQLNAKNSSGAYAGWTDFTVWLVQDGQPVVNISGDGVADGMKRLTIDVMCKGSLIRP